jgi:hypothetical protein
MTDLMPNSGGITNGELGRAVERIETAIKDLGTKVDGKPTSADITNIKEELADIQDWRKWSSRGMITVLGGMVVNFAMNLNQAGIG